jgi:hypothetical protein
LDVLRPPKPLKHPKPFYTPETPTGYWAWRPWWWGVAREVAQEKSLNLKITVYKDPEDNLMYKADITIDGWTVSRGGFLDRKYIIDYINMDLQNAWAYLGFLERSSTEESKKMNLDMLLLEIENALADALAYEIGQDNLVTQEEICNRLWRAIGEKWCEDTECAGFVKEDFDACMESCRKAWCEPTPKEEEEQASEKYPRR